MIGNNVWVADRVTMLSGSRTIRNGAVLAAGAVVTHGVLTYAAVAGVPAHTLRMHFGPDSVMALEASHWCEKDIATLIDVPLSITRSTL